MQSYLSCGIKKKGWGKEGNLCFAIKAWRIGGKSGKMKKKKKNEKDGCTQVHSSI